MIKPLRQVWPDVQKAGELDQTMRNGTSASVMVETYERTEYSRSCLLR